MKKIGFVLIGLIIIIFVLAYFLYSNKGTIVKFENTEIEVGIADTPEERMVGLMNRESLAFDEGMLFVFDEEGRRSFWMKNTLIPLDMIFLDKNKKIIDIIKNATPCYEEPCPLYSSEGMYVIEVNAGFVKENNINVGRIVSW